MTEALIPQDGWGVLHLFYNLTARSDFEAVAQAVKQAERSGQQVVSFAVLGHKADLGFMLLCPDLVALRRTQGAFNGAGLDLVGSYLSLTEVSEYAKGMPADRLDARLHPRLPPDGKRALCFYPMSKRRDGPDNWYRLDYGSRLALMHEHGSTGLDDFEWGVTLFAVAPDDLKECVHTMRFDEASARYADFGPFYTGIVAPVEEVLGICGLSS